MKRFVLLLLALLASNAFGDASTDYTAAIDLDTASKQVLRAYARVLVDADSTTLDAAEVLDSGAYLPEGAIVTKTFMKSINKFVSADNNTLALGCSASTDDLFSAVDYSVNSSDELTIGIIQGTSTTDMVKIGDGGCQIRAVVGAGASGITAGRGVFFFEYVVGE